METGCFWITNIEFLKKKKNRIIDPYGAVKVSKKAALEIDTPDDLFVIEKILEKRTNINEKKYFKTRKIIENNTSDYFDPKADPDGIVRDITMEKQRRIDICRNEIDFINSLYDTDIKRKYLDLGCGPGFVASVIDSDKYIKYGLDPSKKAIKIAEQYMDYTVIGFLEDDTFKEEFFDVIFCNHVIEHVEDPIDFVKKLNKILKTHGHLIIASPNFDSGAARLFQDKYRMLHDKTHISLFSDFSLKSLLEDHGFIVDTIDYPFFDTEYFTEENLLRLLDKDKMSPPFYGNFMTLYTRKK
jgi:2-polyprenyl-3-methyl-5-hydroxy-6-metoxy-1,4-benzoquinol methylase